MRSYFSSDFKLGILGGGQLGKMLLYETRKLDIQTYVLDPGKEAPSKIGCDYFEQGDLMNFQTVYQFGKKVDLLTIEIEHVNLEALRQLEKEGITVYPTPSSLSRIQNKGIQKRFYHKHHIPTAPFRIFDSKTKFGQALAKKEIALPKVWKSCEGGYDGKGVAIIRHTKDLESLPDIPCLAEDLIPFKKELAVIVARNPKGELRSYPVIEMEFHPQANQVEFVLCPARISDHVAFQAEKIAIQTALAFQHVGLLAVELFLTQHDELLVNEVAPRPHNSGHFSIEACYTNQFEQHLRAILDLPLGNTQNKVSSVMINLSGAEGHHGPVHYDQLEKILELDGVTPHIYGKRETRPFRKMGHVTDRKSVV